jgi:hypothetical protein
MKLRLKPFLLLLALMAASLLVLGAACGGGDDEEAAPAEGSPGAEETAMPPGETEEPSGDEGEDGGGGGEAPDIPVLPGATETFTGTFTGSDLPFGGFAGTSSLDPEEFSEVQYGVFETDESVDSVVDFYKDQFKDWKEEYTFGGDTEGEAFQMIVWSSDDGKVGAWMMATESEGTTSVVVVTGVQ